MNKRQRIINLLRGRYAVPVISSLGRLGLLEKLKSGISNDEELPHINDRKKLNAILDYLASIELVEQINGCYICTELGNTVFSRSGSADIIESYRDYFNNLDSILTDKKAGDIKVNRDLNIHGSGNLHKKKFFEPSLDMVSGINPEVLIDLGCGDGAYLTTALEKFTQVKKVLLVDLSQHAVKVTYHNLIKVNNDIRINTVTTDAANVTEWSRDFNVGGARELVSAWFVVHEFCSGSINKTIKFFEDVRTARPSADFILGEIINAAPSDIAESCADTIMPEYLLFHALSGQSPLSWSEWQEIKTRIPYELKSQKLYDCITVGTRQIPSSFVWHLTPIK